MSDKKKRIPVIHIRTDDRDEPIKIEWNEVEADTSATIEDKEFHSVEDMAKWLFGLEEEDKE